MANCRHGASTESWTKPEKSFSCPHIRKLVTIVTMIRDLVGHNEVVLGIDSCLYVVADDPSLCRSWPLNGIGIGQRDLLARCRLHSLLQFPELLHLLFQRDDLILQPGCLFACATSPSCRSAASIAAM
jgi:hypothetical protein